MTVQPLADDELPRTWPETGLRPHRFAGIFRMLSGDEKDQLDASVKAKGVLQKIRIFENAILDGRNRYMSAVDTGLFDPARNWFDYPDLFEAFDGTAHQALDLVWSLNEERRHDEKGERAMAAARRKKLLDELAAADPAVATKTDAQLAEEHGVSERLLNSANKVIESASPEVQQAVDDKRMSVTDAAIIAGFDRVEQAIIAQNPDRKAIKRAVKAAKKPSQLPLPELPSPLSRVALSAFAEEAVLLALAAAKKHKGPGASISADAILTMATRHDITEGGAKGHGFTRQMLLVLGRLRDTMPAPAPETDAAPGAPPLGGEWSLKIGGLNGKHSASIAAFHEADETFSISVNYEFSTRSGSSPFSGTHATFAEALNAAAQRLATTLNAIAGSDDSVTTDAEKKSAHAGLTWLEKKFSAWGLPRPEAEHEPDLLDDAPHIRKAPEGAISLRAAYEKRVGEQGDQKGHHTKASAEPLLRAGRSAEVDWQKIADDLGHPLGTVQGWSFKLGMTGKGTGRSGPRRRQAAEAVA